MKINNCLFCKSGDCELRVSTFHDMPDYSSVVCRECGATGPVPKVYRYMGESDHDKKVIKLWNRVL